MKRLTLSIFILTSSLLLSSCFCNTGCGGSTYDVSYYSGNCCGGSTCCGTGGW